MSKPNISTRSLRYFWYQLLGTKKIIIDGVWVSTELKDVPASIQRMLFRKTYEDRERELVKSIIKPNSRVLEIGAGIGLISLVANKIARSGEVRAYEANPKMENIIRKNYTLNGLKPDLVMKAVTSDGKPVSFFIDDEILSSSLIDRNKGHTETTIESDKFQTIIKEFDPNVIVMDVEGAEINLLDSKDLQTVEHIIVELHPHIVGQEKIDQLLQNLEKIGFFVSTKKGKVFLLTNKS